MLLTMPQQSGLALRGHGLDPAVTPRSRPSTANQDVISMSRGSSYKMRRRIHDRDSSSVISAVDVDEEWGRSIQNHSSMTGGIYQPQTTYNNYHHGSVRRNPSSCISTTGNTIRHTQRPAPRRCQVLISAPSELFRILTRQE